jgi:tetratricopeptide (TPR) repeat protein
MKPSVLSTFNSSADLKAACIEAAKQRGLAECPLELNEQKELLPCLLKTGTNYSSLSPRQFLHVKTRNWHLLLDKSNLFAALAAAFVVGYWIDYKDSHFLFEALGLATIAAVIAPLCQLHHEHQSYTSALGIPAPVLTIEEFISRHLSTEGNSPYWPEQFLTAIPVGADLQLIWPQFAEWLFSDPKYGLRRLAHRQRTVDLMDAVIDHCRKAEAPFDNHSVELLPPHLQQEQKDAPFTLSSCKHKDADLLARKAAYNLMSGDWRVSSTLENALDAVVFFKLHPHPVADVEEIELIAHDDRIAQLKTETCASWSNKFIELLKSAPLSGTIQDTAITDTNDTSSITVSKTHMFVAASLITLWIGFCTYQSFTSERMYASALDAELASIQEARDRRDLKSLNNHLRNFVSSAQALGMPPEDIADDIARAYEEEEDSEEPSKSETSEAKFAEEADGQSAQLACDTAVAQTIVTALQGGKGKRAKSEAALHLANLYLLGGRVNEAENTVSEIVATTEQDEKTGLGLAARSLLSKIYQQQSKLREAQILLENSLKSSQNLTNVRSVSPSIGKHTRNEMLKQQAIAAEELSKVYERLGDYHKALEWERYANSQMQALHGRTVLEESVSEL